jgi:anti-anti-sigma factor
MMQMECHVDGSAESCWRQVRVAGDLDIATGPSLDQILRRLDAAHPGSQVVLDLSAVTFIDCSGLGALLRARNLFGDRFWLRVIPPTVSRLFDLTGVDATFAVLSDDVAPPGSASNPECTATSIVASLGQVGQRPSGDAAAIVANGSFLVRIRCSLANRIERRRRATRCAEVRLP